MGYYRPLPHNLTIKESNINGLGLFTKEDIPSNTSLGVTHIYNDEFEDGLIRTPLGGFFNHSEEPNIKLDEITYSNGIPWTKVMVTIRDIKAGEEITARYTMYDPTK